MDAPFQFGNVPNSTNVDGGFAFAPPPDWSASPFTLDFAPATTDAILFGATEPSKDKGKEEAEHTFKFTSPKTTRNNVARSEATFDWGGMIDNNNNNVNDAGAGFGFADVTPNIPVDISGDWPAPAAPNQGEWDVIELLSDSSPLLKELVVLPYDSTELICSALPRNTCLESLDMTIASPSQFGQVSEAIAQAQPTLKSVALDWPELASFSGVLEQAETLFASQLLINQGITHLKIRSSTPIFEAIVNNPRIRHVAIETGNAGNLEVLGNAVHLKSLRIGWGNSKDLTPLVNRLVEHAREGCLEELDLCSPAGKYKGVAGEEDPDAPTVSKLLQLTSKLRVLHLRGCYGPRNDVSRGVLVNRTLTKLCIHGLNSDAHADRDALCEAIGEHPYLREVDLRNVYTVTVQALSRLLRAPNLQRVRVTGCGVFTYASGVHDSSNQAIIAAWQVICTTLTTRRLQGRPLELLDLSTNPFGSPVAAEMMLCSIPPADALILAGSRMGDEGLRGLALGLRANSSLLHLDISGCNGQVDMVLPTLAEHLSLRHLDISDPSGLSLQHGAAVPAFTLCGLHLVPITRRCLSLKMAFSGTLTDAAAFFDSLVGSACMLRYLDVSDCNFSGAGTDIEAACAALCRAISNNRTLETLKMSNLGLTHDHMDRVAIALQQNRTLSTLSCYGYEARTEALDKNLCRAIAVSALETLEIGSRTRGFSRVILQAIDVAPHLHSVVIYGPENFEADFLLSARNKLRWKQNVARVQRNCVRAAIDTWLSGGLRPGPVASLGRDVRRMIAAYVWKTRLQWPLPAAEHKPHPDAGWEPHLTPFSQKIADMFLSPHLGYQLTPLSETPAKGEVNRQNAVEWLFGSWVRLFSVDAHGKEALCVGSPSLESTDNGSTFPVVMSDPATPAERSALYLQRLPFGSELAWCKLVVAHSAKVLGSQVLGIDPKTHALHRMTWTGENHQRFRFVERGRAADGAFVFHIMSAESHRVGKGHPSLKIGENGIITRSFSKAQLWKVHLLARLGPEEEIQHLSVALHEKEGREVPQGPMYFVGIAPPSAPSPAPSDPVASPGAAAAQPASPSAADTKQQQFVVSPSSGSTKPATEGRRAILVAKRGQKAVTASPESGAQWQCASCSASNAAGSSACAVCMASRDYAPPKPSKTLLDGDGEEQDSDSSSSDEKVKSWRCSQCTTVNDGSSKECSACDNPRPPVGTMFDFSVTHPNTGGGFAGLAGFTGLTSDSGWGGLLRDEKKEASPSTQLVTCPKCFAGYAPSTFGGSCPFCNHNSNGK